MVVAGRARAIVVGVGANTAMGNIRDSILQTDDVSFVFSNFCLFIFYWRKSYNTWGPIRLSH